MTTFPTMVYRSPGAHAGPRGTYDFLGIADDAAMKAALADGWRLSVAEACGLVEANAVIEEVAEALEAVAEVTPEGREALEAKAKELGVSFNARTSDKVLAERIAAAG